MKTYTELLTLKTFKERFEYLRLGGKVGEYTFGGARWLNQTFYNFDEWKEFRRKIIIRDNGCDLGIDSEPINGIIHVHHIVTITKEDILNRNISKILNPDNVICCSERTHKAIHYSNPNILIPEEVERKPFDTCPWRQ